MSDLIRSSGLTGYRALVTRLGGDPLPLLRRSNISLEALERDDALMSFRSMIRLLEITAAELECADFGLQLSQQQDLRILGPVGIIGINSPTVGDAIEAMIEHLDFYSPVVLCRVDRDTDAPNVLLTWDLSISGEPHKRQVTELAMGLYQRHMQTLTHSQFVPVAVLLRHTSPLSVSIYRRYFGQTVKFGQAVNALVVRPADLQRRLDNTDLNLRRVIAEYVSQSKTSHPLDTRRQVEYLARRLLPSGRCSLKIVAQHLCLHERTLQRRLTQAGLLFEEVVEAVRRERAEELLSESRLSMAQIAQQLGFAEQSSFSRACRRWFGVTPLRLKRTGTETALRL